MSFGHTHVKSGWYFKTTSQRIRKDKYLCLTKHKHIFPQSDAIPGPYLQFSIPCNSTICAYVLIFVLDFWSNYGSLAIARSKVCMINVLVHEHISWVNNSMIHLRFWKNECIWMNHLSKWLNDSTHKDLSKDLVTCCHLLVWCSMQKESLRRKKMCWLLKHNKNDILKLTPVYYLSQYADHYY